jgi:hypothetical protein
MHRMAVRQATMPPTRRSKAIVAMRSAGRPRFYLGAFARPVPTMALADLVIASIASGIGPHQAGTDLTSWRA